MDRCGWAALLYWMRCRTSLDRQTHLQATDDTEEFVHAADITPSGGTFWITLQPNYVYTISTRTDACKSSAHPAQANAFVLPHSESFESPLKVGQRAPFFGDESGSFQVGP